MSRALPFLFAVLTATTASAGITWRGDVETGNTSQYSGLEVREANRVLAVDTPVRQGKYSLRFMVKQGDSVTGSGSGNRSEVLASTYEPTGSEYFYKWSSFFPSTFPREQTWQVFAQWHHSGCCGSPPVEFFVVGDTMFLRTGGATGPIQWSAPLNRATWHDFVFHVKWSPDPKVGFIELWHNGEKVIAKRFAATQFAGQLNYLKMGLYRDSAIATDGVVFHDGVVQATSLNDVMPPAAAPTPTVIPNPSSPNDGAPGVETAGDENSDPDVLTASNEEGTGSDVESGALGTGVAGGQPPVVEAAAAIGSIGCASSPADAALWLATAVFASLLFRRRAAFIPVSRK
ncbi:MAG: polysaccharide lyase [Myxococcaceae bacterium]